MAKTTLHKSRRFAAPASLATIFLDIVNDRFARPRCALSETAHPVRLRVAGTLVAALREKKAVELRVAKSSFTRWELAIDRQRRARGQRPASGSARSSLIAQAAQRTNVIRIVIAPNRRPIARAKLGHDLHLDQKMTAIATHEIDKAVLLSTVH